MITRMSLMVLALTANVASADAVQYLVKFKSPETYAMVAQSFSRSPFMAPLGHTAPIQLFNGRAQVSEALTHLQMLIVSSDDSAAIEQLRKNPSVAFVEQEIFHPLPQPMATHSVAFVKSKSKKIARPWGIDAVRAPQAWSVTRGRGARVMVLDTGVDKNHPAVRGQLELVKNLISGGPENDVTDTVGHGTHVAGTILADGQGDGLIGVAPEARLLMGKVCSEAGCSSAAIARGINWAVEQRVDVVNMSLGGRMISEGEMIAIRTAEANGVYIAAASGNEGQAYVSFPAAVETITAVGAVDSSITKADFSQWGPELDIVGPGVDVLSSVPQGSGRGASVEVDLGKGLDTVNSVPFTGSPVRESTGELIYVGLGKAEDYNGLDVAGKIVLIARGEIPFKDKVATAAAKGAIAALIFNNAPGLTPGTLSEDGSEAAIAAIMIEKSTGELARSRLQAGEVVRVEMAVEATDYASFQGTSMATPHVAGVAALVRSVNRSLTPAEVRDILTSTAVALGPNTENQYGSGLVDAEAAVRKAMANVQLALSVAN